MQKNKSICVEKELKIFQKKFEKTMNKHEKIMINSLKKLSQCSTIDYEKLNNMRDKEKIEYLITKIEDIKNNSNKSFSILHKNLIEDFVNKYADNLYECVGFYCYNNEYNYIIYNNYIIEDDEEDYAIEDDEEDYAIEDDEEDYAIEDEEYADLFKNPWESYEDGYRDGYNNCSYNEYNGAYLRGYEDGQKQRQNDDDDDDEEEERRRQEEYGY